MHPYEGFEKNPGIDKGEELTSALPPIKLKDILFRPVLNNFPDERMSQDVYSTAGSGYPADDMRFFPINFL